VERRFVASPVGVLPLSGEVTIGEPGDAGLRLELPEGVLKTSVSFSLLVDLVSLGVMTLSPALAVVCV
jgi:hypothetical protein